MLVRGLLWLLGRLPGFAGWLVKRAGRLLFRNGHAPKRITLPEERKITVLMIGFKATGKTLMLAALYECFKLGGERGITLIPDDASERELSKMTRDIRDTSNPYLPAGTRIGETREWRFGVWVDWKDKRDRVFELTYLDYAGEHAEDLASPVDPEQAAPNEKFLRALRDSSVVMGIIDGGKVLKLMIDGYSALIVSEVEFILRRLVLAEQKSIHLIISKWDLLVDRSGHHYTLNQVISALESYSPRFRNFRQNPRFRSLRIIPVAALGTGFVRPDPGDSDGKSMVKVTGAPWDPENAAIPFFCAIPDIIKCDVDLLAAHARGSHGRKAARSKIRISLSWVTVAAAGIAGITFAITTHGITATAAFISIIERIDDALRERPRKERSKPQGEDTALGHVLRTCYDSMAHYERLNL